MFVLRNDYKCCFKKKFRVYIHKVHYKWQLVQS